MERLTSRNGDCVRINGRALHAATVGDIVQMAERLAEYEDARLSPRACAQAAEIENWLSDYDYSIRRMVELMNADKDGRVAITPCKIGDTVYFTTTLYHSAVHPIAATVKRIRGISEDGKVSYSATTGDGNKRFFGSNELGKTVFLEEAEAREHIKCRERAAPVDAAAILAECDKRFAKLCEDRYREFYGEDV